MIKTEIVEWQSPKKVLFFIFKKIYFGVLQIIFIRYFGNICEFQFRMATTHIWMHFIIGHLLLGSNGLDNNLALTPPMGWSAWGRFRCNIDCERFPKECISEWLFRDMADRMAEDGYMSAGYEYILMDDCWLADRRDSQGYLKPNPERFPSGIRNLSDYVHSKGLKFGIYEDYGTKTCEGYPGILEVNMPLDAETFTRWGVDYVKLDGCYSDPLDMEQGYIAFGNWLRHMGRPMVYACSWPVYQLSIGLVPNYSVAAETCNSWRNYKDIQDSYSSLRNIINYFGDFSDNFYAFGGPGHWNDPDMLIIGNFGLSYEQAKVQMVIWAILPAPLIMSHDMRAVQPEFKNLLLNPAVIQVNQDPMGIPGRRIYVDRKRRYEVWARAVVPAVCGRFSWVIAILNLDDEGAPRTIIFPLKYTKLRGNYRHYSMYNLLEPTEVVEFTNRKELVTRVPPLGVQVYKAFVVNC